jgi:hypothetical protein
MLVAVFGATFLKINTGSFCRALSTASGVSVFNGLDKIYVRIPRTLRPELYITILYVSLSGILSTFDSHNDPVIDVVMHTIKQYTTIIMSRIPPTVSVSVASIRLYILSIEKYINKIRKRLMATMRCWMI